MYLISTDSSSKTIMIKYKKCPTRCFSFKLFEVGCNYLSAIVNIRINVSNDNIYIYTTFVHKGKFAKIGSSLGNHGYVTNNGSILEKDYEIKRMIKECMIKNPLISQKQLSEIVGVSCYKVARYYMSIRRSL